MSGSAPAAFALPRVMGHRGAAALAPENTLSSIEAAARAGLTWVEFDVKLTGDGVPILFHDDTLKRITGRDGEVIRTNYAALQDLEAGAWFDGRFAGEPIPSLEAAVGLIETLGLSANVEIKPCPGRERETAEAALALLEQSSLVRGRLLVSSFSEESLAAAQQAAPQVPRALIALKLPRNWKTIARRLACSTIHLLHRRITARRAAAIKQAGYGLAAFTVNGPKQAKALLDLGVDCLITDDPEALRPVLPGKA